MAHLSRWAMFASPCWLPLAFSIWLWQFSLKMLQLQLPIGNKRNWGKRLMQQSWLSEKPLCRWWTLLSWSGLETVALWAPGSPNFWMPEPRNPSESSRWDRVPKSSGGLSMRSCRTVASLSIGEPSCNGFKSQISCKCWRMQMLMSPISSTCLMFLMLTWVANLSWTRLLLASWSSVGLFPRVIWWPWDCKCACWLRKSSQIDWFGYYASYAGLSRRVLLTGPANSVHASEVVVGHSWQKMCCFWSIPVLATLLQVACFCSGPSQDGPFLIFVQREFAPCSLKVYSSQKRAWAWQAWQTWPSGEQ